jgi:hypothetical protein
MLVVEDESPFEVGCRTWSVPVALPSRDPDLLEVLPGEGRRRRCRRSAETIATRS